MAPIRILLADPSSEYCEVARRVLSTDQSIMIIGDAASGRETLEAAARLRPDLVLLDVALSHPNGLETARRMKAAADAPLVVIMALDDLPDYQVAAADAGADGFVVKGELGAEILPLLHALADSAY